MKTIKVQAVKKGIAIVLYVPWSKRKTRYGAIIQPAPMGKAILSQFDEWKVSEDYQKKYE